MGKALKQLLKQKKLKFHKEDLKAILLYLEDRGINSLENNLQI